MSVIDATEPPTAICSQPGDPTWEVVNLYPRQGEWTEEQYLQVVDQFDGPVELSNGCLEFLPMVTPQHQDIVFYLARVLREFVVGRRLGKVFPSPLPVRLTAGKFRDPDVIYIKRHRVADRARRPEGADLVMEVVSPGEKNRHRDYEVKRAEYAVAGIAEYWLIDPTEERITVLTLAESSYEVHGEFLPGEAAASALLEGFSVEVNDVLKAGEDEYLDEGATQ